MAAQTLASGLLASSSPSSPLVLVVSFSLALIKSLVDCLSYTLYISTSPIALMPATKNHLYHSLSLLILLAAFLVSLLAFLAPTPILSDRVSLLEVTASASRAAKTRRWIAPDDSVARAYSNSAHGFVKRAKKANSSSIAAATVPVTVKIGPLGASLSSAL